MRRYNTESRRSFIKRSTGAATALMIPGYPSPTNASELMSICQAYRLMSRDSHDLRYPYRALRFSAVSACLAASIRSCRAVSDSMIWSKCVTRALFHSSVIITPCQAKLVVLGWFQGSVILQDGLAADAYSEMRKIVSQ